MRWVLVFLAAMAVGFICAAIPVHLARNNCAHRVIGDINDDSVTDITDFSILSASYGSPHPYPKADLTCDGIVDIRDVWVLEAGIRIQQFVASTPEAPR